MKLTALAISILLIFLAFYIPTFSNFSNFSGQNSPSNLSSFNSSTQPVPAPAPAGSQPSSAPSPSAQGIPAPPCPGAPVPQSHGAPSAPVVSFAQPNESNNYSFLFRAVPESIPDSLYYEPEMRDASPSALRFGTGIPPSSNTSNASNALKNLDIVLNVFINYSVSVEYYTKVTTVHLSSSNNFTSYLNLSFPDNSSLHFLSYFSHIYNQTYFLFFYINTGFSASSGFLFLNSTQHQYNITVPLKYEPFVWPGLLAIAPYSYSQNQTEKQKELQADALALGLDAGYPMVYSYASNSALIYNWSVDYGGRYLTNIAPEGATVSSWWAQSNITSPQEESHWLTTFFVPGIYGVNHHFVENNFTAYILAYPPGKVSTYTVYVFSGNVSALINTIIYSEYGYMDFQSPYYGNSTDILFKEVSTVPIINISLPSASGPVTFEAIVNYTDGTSLFRYDPLYIYTPPKISVIRLCGESYDYLEIKDFDPYMNETGYGLDYNNLQNVSVVLPNGTEIPLSNFSNSSVPQNLSSGWSSVQNLSSLGNITLKINSLPNPVTAPNWSLRQYFPYPVGAVLVDGLPYFSDYSYGLYNNYEPYSLPNWLLLQPSALHGLYGTPVPAPNGYGWEVLKVPHGSSVSLVDIFGNPIPLTNEYLSQNASLSGLYNITSGYFVTLNATFPTITINFDKPFFGVHANATGSIVISGLLKGLSYSHTAMIVYQYMGREVNITIPLSEANGTLVGRFSVPASAGYFIVVYNSTVPFIGVVIAGAGIPVSQFGADLIAMLPYLVFGGLLVLLAYIFIRVMNKLYNREEGGKK